MLNGRDLICIFDGTFDGFLSVVYYTVKNRVRPVRICREGEVQLQMGACAVRVQTNVAEGEKVRGVLCDSVGYEGFKRAYYAFLCDEPESVMDSYKYILYALKYGRKTANYMSHPDINKAYKLERRVSHEADRLKGFLRFSVMEGGVEYATVEPDNDILPLLMIHFADRLRNIPFVIHDVKRQKAGLCMKGSWYITSAEDIEPPDLSEGEKDCRMLWKAFYNAICIKERRNLELQRQMLPKKYRKHITEFN